MSDKIDISTAIEQARQLIDTADSLIITAGAGMSVDSGLPDYRGDQGFWRAYSALGAAKIPFERLSSSVAFAQAPELAWGFFGHRLGLYRDATPHAGYAILRDIAQTKVGGAFVVTSNVDGQFATAGFDATRILEIHGSLHYLQCVDTCSEAVWAADRFVPDVDIAECLLCSPLPLCPDCGALVRPNVLMYSDWGWNEARTAGQKQRFAAWRKTVNAPVVIELGAGETIAAIRHFSERQRVPLIRINPAQPQLSGAMTSAGSVAIPLGALAALQLLVHPDH